jgi:hypothetical protein
MKPLLPLALVGVVAASTASASQGPLETLGTTLGLSALAGINLYLTVFVTGLAIQNGWLTNYPPALEVLGDPGIILLSGVFYALGFFADKVPWVDSLNDTIHTFIRPIGGAFIAIKGLGTTDPMLDVVAGLLGGTVAFTTHATKAGTRLIVNHSPEPFSNIAVSFGEDAGVLGGTWLSFQHPVIMLTLVCLFLAAFVYFGPKAVRMMKAEFLWIGSRVSTWFGRTMEGRLKRDHQEALNSLPPRLADRIHTLLDQEERLLFAIPCFSGRMRNVGRYTRGAVIGTNSGRLWYLGRKNFRVRTKQLRIEGAAVEMKKRFLFDEIIVRTTTEDGAIGIRFSKLHAPLATELMDWLRARCAKVEMPAETAAVMVEMRDPSVG